MSTLWGILAFIFAILAFAMFLGMINPNWINRRLKEGQKPITRKKAATLWIVFGFIFCIFVGLSNPSTDNATLAGPVNEATNSPNPAATPTATIAPTPTEDPAVKKAAADKAQADKDAKAKQAADDKKKEDDAAKVKTANEAKITYDKFNEVIDEYNQVAKILNTVVNGLADGSIDAVSAYSTLGKLDDAALNVFSNAESLKVVDRYSKPKEDLVDTVSYLENGIKELQKYLDNQKVSVMASATDDLKSAKQGIQLVTFSVAAQVVIDGYTPPTPKK